MKDQYTILIAEDDETDVLLFTRALREAGVANPVQVVNDGQEAIDYLDERRQAISPGDRMPILLVLDLKMPRLTGIDVLEYVRSEPALRSIPAIVFTSSSHQQDIERALAAGANAFVVKSPSTTERIEFARFIKSWIHFNHPPLSCTDGFRAAQSFHAVSPRPASG